MSDELRRQLAREAGEGDLVAAQRLVTLLRREGLARDWPLSPEQRVWLLGDDDFGGKGRRVRILQALRASPLVHPNGGLGWADYAHRRLQEITLKDVSLLTFNELARSRGMGQVLLASIDAVLARAGLHTKDDPTLTARSWPNGLPASSSPSEGSAAP